MTPTLYRRLLLVALVGATLAALSCGNESCDPRAPGCERLIDGYTWYSAMGAAPNYHWVKVSRAQLANYCGNPNALACAIDAVEDGCIVWSYMDEATAKAWRPYPESGTTVWQHEVWNDDKTIGHCAGFAHREREIRVITTG